MSLSDWFFQQRPASAKSKGAFLPADPSKSGEMDPFARLRIAIGILILLIAVGTAGYHWIEGISLLDSLYMTVITLATIGYREVVSPNTAGKIFTLLLIAGGVTTGAWALQSMLQTLLSEEMHGTVFLHHMQKQIDGLRNHYIICGYGRMGRQVAAELRLKKVPCVVVDRSEEVIEELTANGDFFVQGDANEDAVLLRAGIERAKGLITVASTDVDNVFITLTARGLNPKLDIVARSVLRDNEEKLERAGANRVISPYVIGGRWVAAAVLSPNVIDFLEAALYDPSSNLEWSEAHMAPDSPLIGQAIIDARLRQQYGIIVVGLRRGDRIITIGPETVIQEGDILIVLGAPELIRAFALATRCNVEEAPI
jgi:voltage-gated potassium channel